MRKIDGFQIIEYIRSSIEIIMNLKVEDLEREISLKNQIPAHETSIDGGADSLNSSSRQSINPQSFVLASMKEALLAATSVKQHGSKSIYKSNSTGSGGGLI